MQFITRKGGTLVGVISDTGVERATVALPFSEHSTSLSQCVDFMKNTRGCKYIVNCGDIAVGDETYFGGYQGQCGDFFGLTASYHDNYHAIMGNEDIDGWGAAAFNAYFGYTNQYYTHSYDNMEFFALYQVYDTGTEMQAGSVEYLWLSSSMAVSRAKPNIKWRVAQIHNNAVTSVNSKHYTSSVLAAVPWQAWGFDVVLQGHNHVIERSESGSVVFLNVAGASNQKDYYLTTQSVYSKYFHGDTVNESGWPGTEGYVFLIMDSYKDELWLTYYDKDGNIIADTGSTGLSFARKDGIGNYSTVITKTSGGQPTGSSNTFTLVSNRFVESGSWNYNIDSGSTSSEADTASYYLPRNSKWNVYQEFTAPSTMSSNSSSQWPSASFNDSAYGWSGSIQAPASNNYATTSKVPPTGWGLNWYTGLRSPSSSPLLTTHYFRTTMSLSNSGSDYSFTAKYIVDDAAAVWINEQLAFTSSLMPISWSYNSLATTSTDATTLNTRTLTSSLFRSGSNIIGVEVHQNAGSSSDIVWAMEITASYVGPAVSTPTSSTVTIISSSATWRYFDTSSLPSDRSWISESYVDTAWSSSNSVFRNSSTSPTLPSGWAWGAVGLKYSGSIGPWTHFFRNTFTSSLSASRYDWTFKYLADDGIVVWVNGNKAHSYNMPTTVNNQTSASSGVDIGAAPEEAILDSDYFRSGSNTIAVELHQATLASGDAIFGASLEVSPKEMPTTGSKLTFGSDGTLTLSVGKLTEETLASPPSYSVVARLSNLGYLYSDQISEIPATMNLVFYSDAADEFSREDPIRMKNQYELGHDIILRTSSYVAASSSYIFTNTSTLTIPTSQYGISTNNYGVFTTASSWTVECVFKLHNSASYTRGYLIGRSSASKCEGIYTTDGNKLGATYFWHNSGATEVGATSSALSINKWYHAVLVYDNSATSSFTTYLNKVSVATASYIMSGYALSQMTSDIVGGSPIISGSSLDYCSNAYIPIVALYTRALSKEEVAGCYNYYDKRFHF